MRQSVNFDATLKDLFQRERLTLLQRLSGGVPVKEFLNVELPKVQQRRVDLLIALLTLPCCISNFKVPGTGTCLTGCWNIGA
jgi:hypothetical protein